MVHRKPVRLTAGLLAVLMLVPLMGCQQAVNNESTPGPASRPGGPPGPASRPGGPPGPAGPQRRGMSTRNKVLLLAGAAALYYLYNKHKNRQGQGAEGRYYLSKNGRVYYRDLKTGAYRWVDPPQQPIRVNADEYERYTGQQVDDYAGQVIRQAPPGWPPQPASGYGSSPR